MERMRVVEMPGTWNDSCRWMYFSLAGMENNKSAGGQWRVIAFILYVVVLEFVGIGCLSLAIFSMKYEPITKLQIWSWFERSIPNLPPILVIVAASLTILTPIIGLVGVIRKNQITIAVFFAMITLVAFIWFGIGAWCLSMHKLIVGDISIRFDRLQRDGASDSSEARQFLIDLRDFMPRINSKQDFVCCPSTSVDALHLCAQDCATRYEGLFTVVVFPSLYSTLFGAGGFCLLSLLCACLVSCHLDDVNPAF